MGDDALLVLFVQVLEVVGDAFLDLLAAVLLRVGQDLFPPFAHALQGAAGGIDGRGHTAVEHGHREADCSVARRFFTRSGNRLVFDVAGQFVVEVEFVAVQVEGGGADLALGE